MKLLPFIFTPVRERDFLTYVKSVLQSFSTRNLFHCSSTEQSTDIRDSNVSNVILRSHVRQHIPLGSCYFPPGFLPTSSCNVILLRGPLLL